eukprot:COSAG04_NODE_16053_length_511_cov_0.995146_1_plen_87_part_10
MAQTFRASKAGRYGLRCCCCCVGRSTLGRYDGNVYEAIYDEARKSPLNGKRMAVRPLPSPVFPLPSTLPPPPLPSAPRRSCKSLAGR